MKLNKKIIACIIIFLIYALFTFLIVLHHEIWSDEAQVWVAVRDMNLFELFSHVRTEGHPLLWYFLIMPFAKLLHGINSVFSMQLLNWFFVISAAAVFLFKSPFNTAVKISLLISSAFLYWYPVVARSYCLIPILLFSLAMLYKKQKEHPYWYTGLLVLLANTHIIMFGFCFALALLFVLQNREKKYIPASLLIFVCLFSTVGYIYGAQNENYVVKTAPHFQGIYAVFDVYKKLVYNIFANNSILFTSLFSLFLIFCSYVLYVKNKTILFVITFSFLYQFSIYFFIWGPLPQRAFLIFLTILFGFWIIFPDIKSNKIKNTFSTLFILCMLFTLPSSFDIISKDYQKDFSNGKETAEFIRKNIPSSAVFVTPYSVITPSISAYLPQNKTKWRIFYPGYNDFYTYTIWNKEVKVYDISDTAKELLEKYEVIYLITIEALPYDNLKLIYSSNYPTLREIENFRIYKIEKGQYD